MNPLQPSAAVLVKLGSIAVHADEFLSPLAHHFDRAAIENLLKDPEIVEWRKAMDAMALLPVKRTIEDVRLAAKSRRIK